MRINTILFTVIMLLSSVNLSAETVDDLKFCTQNYVLVMDDVTNNGAAKPGKGNLFGDGYFLDVTGGSVATNKGSWDLSLETTIAVLGTDKYAEYGAHRNCFRLKNGQDIIAMKVVAGTKIIILGQTHATRWPQISDAPPSGSLMQGNILAGLADGSCSVGRTVNTVTENGYFEWVADADRTIYIGSQGGDYYISYIIVEAPIGVPSVNVSEMTYDYDKNMWYREVTCKPTTIDSETTICTYTTDGTVPTAQSPVYTAPIRFYESGVVKFQAFKDLGDGIAYDNAIILGANSEDFINIEDLRKLTDTSWDFTKGVSEYTLKLLNADTEQWTQNGFDSWTTVNAVEGELTAKGIIIPEFAGLQFKQFATGYAVNYKANCVRLQKDCAFDLPELKAGQKIVIKAKSANNIATDRGLGFCNATIVSGPKDGICLGSEVGAPEGGVTTFELEVDEDGIVTVSTGVNGAPASGIEILSIIIDEGDYDGTADIPIAITLVNFDRETALNSRTAVDADMANALKVNATNILGAVSVTYTINEMNMNESEEGVFWTVGKELASGEANINSIAYAELDSTIHFLQDIKYQVSVSVLNRDLEEIGTYTYEINGSYDDGIIAQGEIGTCIWYVSTDSLLVIAPADGVTGDLPEEGWNQIHDDENYYTTAPWGEYRDVVYSAKIMPGVNATSCNNMFCGMSKMKTANLSNFNTETVTDMKWMFAYCSALTSLDLSNFNTKNVTDMQNMFNGCSALITVDLSNFNVQNVAKMYRMFYKCAALESIDLSSFYVQNVTDMRSMFEDCTALTSVNFSNFNAQKPTDISQMFLNCSSLESVDFSNANTENVTNMAQMFSDCSALTNLDLTNFNTENVTNMEAMFTDCSSLTSLDLSSFNTQKVTDMSVMFIGCYALTSLDLSSFNTENVTDMRRMFSDCYRLTSLNLSNFNMQNVTDMSGMFSMCINLATIISNNETPSSLQVGTFESLENRATCTLQVPTGTKALYAAADGWSELGIIDDGTPDGPEIPEIGELVYTHNGRYKITGNNFCRFKGLTRWVPVSSVEGTVPTIPFTYDATTSSYVSTTDANTEGMAYKFSLDANGTYIVSATLTAGENIPNYTVSQADFGRSIASQKLNIVGVTADGTETEYGRPTEILPGTYTYNWAVDGDGITRDYSITLAGWTPDVRINDIQIHEAVQVGDTRKLARKLQEANAILAISDLITYETSYKALAEAVAACELPEECTQELVDAAYANLTSAIDAIYAEQMEDCLPNEIDKIPVASVKVQKAPNIGVWTDGAGRIFSMVDSNYYLGNYQPGSPWGYGAGKLGLTYETDLVAGTYIFSMELKANARYNVRSSYYDDEGLQFANGELSLVKVDESTETVVATSGLFPVSPYQLEEHLLSVTVPEDGHYKFVMNTTPKTEYADLKYGSIVYVHNASIHVAKAKFPADVIAHGESGTCIWYVDADGQLVIAPADGVSGDLPEEGWTNAGDHILSSVTSAPWGDYRNDVNSVKIMSGVNATSCAYMFSGMLNIETIDLRNLNTQNVTDMSYMFENCSSLTSLDLSDFNTENVTNMRYMFDGCSALASIDISHFNTRNVTDMAGMFGMCTSLTSLDLSNFNTENVTDMSLMFSDCPSMTSIDISSFNTEKVSNMSGMFGAIWLTADQNFKPEEYLLVSLNLTNFNTMSVTDMSNMFVNCVNLTTIISDNEIPSTLQVGTFESLPTRATCTLQVPAGTKALYAAAEGWNELGIIDDGLKYALNVEGNVTLASLTGYADKFNVSNNSTGRLTVNVAMTNRIADYVQQVSGSAIFNQAVSADNVSVEINLVPKQWKFISFPYDVKVADIQKTVDAVFAIRKYSGEKRANGEDAWMKVGATETLNANEGYIISADNGTTQQIKMTFPAAGSTTNFFGRLAKDMTLASHSSAKVADCDWNFIGNPFPSYYTTQSISEDVVLTVWNGSGYTAYSTVDDNYMLKPFEAFFIQSPLNVESISLPAGGRSHGTATTAARLRHSGMSSNRTVLNFVICNSNNNIEKTQSIDRARIIINELSSTGYEAGRDAAKFMSIDKTIPQIFVVSNGESLAIDERPMANGHATLGVYSEEETDYILSLRSSKSQSPRTSEPIYIIDNVTGTVTDLTTSDYRFTATAGTDSNRFTVVLNGNADGIEEIHNSQSTMHNYYNLAGQRINNAKAHKGIVIINGKKVILP